jgi:SnoaL-like domain
VSRALGERFVEAVAARDAAALAACFASGVELRALVPPGLRERTGAAEAAAMISGWFEDSTELELLSSQSEQLADKLYVSYRFAAVEDEQRYLVEQHIFCTLADGKIERADLLCSGFRPRAS